MKEFEKDKVKQGLRDVGFQEGRIFDRALLDQAEQELKRQYLTRALYGVEITTTVTPSSETASQSTSTSSKARLRRSNESISSATRRSPRTSCSG